MVHRVLRIGRWTVDFVFAEDREDYDMEGVLSFLYEMEAPIGKMRQVYRLMKDGKPNRGFTYANEETLRALVVVGPTTSGEQFLNTLVHEVHHLAVFIADGLGLDLRSEDPAYLAGDTAMALAEAVCRLGCEHCRG